MLLNSDQLRAVAIARLHNVVCSGIDEPLRSAAATMLAAHRRGLEAGAPEFETALDALADAVAELPGPFAFHLDVMRVMRGDTAQVTRYRRRNVGAALRDLRRRLGGPPVDADLPAGHPVRVFAAIHWGGVAAWADAARARVQRLKGYWGDRSHQITALRAAAAQHPDTPVTHALLRRCGLHRLAMIVDAAQLATLAAEAGVSRQLTYRPDGFWTANQTIASYAALCRETGVTLSTDALRALGGEASSLRVYARRLFGRFAAFQSAVIARHPDIRPPKRPTAKDGTLLDSWSEVVAFNALGAALPDQPIATHVKLPGERARSTDFVVGGRVPIEVVGMALAAMTTPTSQRQRAYVAKWFAKQARYVALGMVPVVIEPDDIYDPRRLAARIAEVAYRLGCAPPPAPPAGTVQTRSKGTWTFDTLRQAVALVAGTGGVMPTHAALAAAGYGHAAGLLRQPGLRARIVQALGLRDPNRKDIWTRERVVAELSTWVRAHGRWPTNAELLQAGYGDLRSARDRLWAGAQAELRATIADACGRTVTARRAPNGSLATSALVADALRPLAMKLGRMPTADEATRAGLGTAWSRASRDGGTDAMACHIGVAVRSARPRTKAEMMAAFVRVAMGQMDRRLTTEAVRRVLGSGGIAWIRRCGGVVAVRGELARMGIGRV